MWQCWRQRLHDRRRSLPQQPRLPLGQTHESMALAAFAADPQLLAPQARVLALTVCPA
jgi:hypothetical protein